MSSNKYVIDGSILEGGGQIIRVSLTCSSIFKIPLVIENIRGKRSKPGLQNQHLAGVNLLMEICNAYVKGNTLQSVQLRFDAKKISSGNYLADSKTAGSVCLIMQATIPTLLFAPEPSSLSLMGGTDAEFAPPISYYHQIVQFYMSKMGMNISIDLVSRGFFPRGGGHVRVDICPVEGYIHPISLTERGQICRASATCFVAGSLPISIAKDMDDAIRKTVQSHSKYRQMPLTSDVFKEHANAAVGDGSGCMLVVETSTGCRFGFNVVGKRGYSGSQMGADVARQFVDFFNASGACLDSQMQDQILLFMALAKGRSTIRCSELTLHSQTCIFILEKITCVKFSIEPIQSSSDVIVRCDGVGISNNHIN